MSSFKWVLLLSLPLLAPCALYYFTDEVSLQSSLSGNIMTVQFSKPGGGFLSWGFGQSMSASDIFLLQIQNNALYLLNCVTTGQVAPTCQNTGPWSLTASSFNTTTRGWTATVQRDISVSRGIQIYQTVNKIIYNYALNETMPSGHSYPSNRNGVISWDISTNSVNKSVMRVGLTLLMSLLSLSLLI